MTGRQIYHEAFRAGAAPDPVETVSEWADNNRVLGQGEGSEPGPWRTSRTPYLKEIMDCLSPMSPVQEVSMEKGKQIGATVGIAANFVGYVIAKCPGVIMIVIPTVDTGRKWSRQKLTPLIENTPVLRGKVSEPRERDAHNTQLSKDFEGGTLFITGSNSAATLRSTSAKFLVFDEMDAYPQDVDGEGDPVELAKGRSVNYPRRKILMISTPGVDDLSRIDPEFRKGDMRYFFVPCPFCSWYQVFKFARLEYWPKDKPTHAHYNCCHCAQPIEEHHKTQMLANGRWVPTAGLEEDLINLGFAAEEIDARAYPPTGKRASYHLSGLYSPIGWFSWIAAAQQWVEAQTKPSLLKVFINTVLGETWRERGEQPEWRRLYDRREDYEVGIVPHRGLFLTCGADIQKDRIELEVVAWGVGKESWSIAYEVIPGDTSTPAPWIVLAGVLARDFECERGGTLPIMALAVDTGYRPQNAYQFARVNPQAVHGPAHSQVISPRSVIPVKGGDSQFKIIENVSSTDAAAKRHGVKIVTVGTACAKQELYDWLHLDQMITPDTGAYIPTAGYCHFPSYEQGYFQGLCSERKVTRANGGHSEWIKDPNVRNEPLDARIYARAAAALCGLDSFKKEHWDEMVRRYEGRSLPAPIPQRSAVVQDDQQLDPTKDWDDSPPAEQPRPAQQPAQRGRTIRGRLSIL